MNIHCNSTSYSPRRDEEYITSSNTVHVSPIQHQVGVSHEAAASPTPRRQIQVRSSIDADIGTSKVMYSSIRCSIDAHL